RVLEAVSRTAIPPCTMYSRPPSGAAAKFTGVNGIGVLAISLFVVVLITATKAPFGLVTYANVVGLAYNSATPRRNHRLAIAGWRTILWRSYLVNKDMHPPIQDVWPVTFSELYHNAGDAATF